MSISEDLKPSFSHSCHRCQSHQEDDGQKHQPSDPWQGHKQQLWVCRTMFEIFTSMVIIDSVDVIFLRYYSKRPNKVTPWVDNAVNSHQVSSELMDDKVMIQPLTDSPFTFPSYVGHEIMWHEEHEEDCCKHNSKRSTFAANQIPAHHVKIFRKDDQNAAEDHEANAQSNYESQFWDVGPPKIKSLLIISLMSYPVFGIFHLILVNLIMKSSHWLQCVFHQLLRESFANR